ncbi:GerAB/ArcD/ProY family transporter [Paenibacillus sp. MWE-103]|uniref:GerAB/ArcD/ProY family transporter n=1 Tax=Paenibacillus artemisiicola TaxID=1172618 RepID=A0ABS3WCN5_9BACL|nr:GerAB/ArcD/ProY family transporter [Paenibacillus artemisiicola]MBO7746089.1 GerAB/ArcD/ProY family transporter [Paenibacillus artemisiicola]
MKERSLSHWPVFMMLTLSARLSAHVIVLPAVLDVSARDAWLCGLLAFAIVIPWLAVFLYGSVKRTNGIHIRAWLRTRATPFGAWLIVLPVMLELLLTSYQAYIETAVWTSTTFLPITPEIVVLIVLMALNVAAAYCGLRAIAYMSCLLLPVVVVLGDFVMSANMPHKDYSVLLPMLEHGWGGALHGTIYAASSLMEIFLFLFLQHYMKNRIRLWELVLFCVFIAVLMIGPTIGAITQFGPVEAEKLRYPAFSQWRLVSIGKYFEHVDFFAIFQWASGSFIRVTLGLVLIMELVPIRGKKGRLWFLAIAGAVYIVVSRLLASVMIQAELVMRAIFVVDLAIAFGVTAAIWLLSFKGVPKGGMLDDRTPQPAGAGEGSGTANNL